MSHKKMKLRIFCYTDSDARKLETGHRYIWIDKIDVENKPALCAVFSR